MRAGNQFGNARKYRRQGFTLIELLVVVAIIAILISILLPALGRAKRQSQVAVCLSNMRNVMLAVNLYADENRGWFPEWGFAHGGGLARSEQAWINTTSASYGHEDNILRCPADRSPHWTEPLQQPDGPLRKTSYATNFYLTAGGIDNPLWARAGRAFNRRDWIKRPASTIFFCELVETGDYALADHIHVDEWDFWYPDDRALAATQVALERHDGAADYAMVDGHAERLRYEETYRIKGMSGAYGEAEFLVNKYDPTFAR